MVLMLVSLMTHGINFLIPYVYTFSCTCWPSVFVQCHSFARDLHFPDPVIEETVCSLLYVRGSFATNSSAVQLWAYCWALCSVALICVCVFMPGPILCCLQLCNVV